MPERGPGARKRVHDVHQRIVIWFSHLFLNPKQHQASMKHPKGGNIYLRVALRTVHLCEPKQPQGPPSTIENASGSHRGRFLLHPRNTNGPPWGGLR